jgi:polymorphic membrane protein
MTRVLLALLAALLAGPALPSYAVAPDVAPVPVPAAGRAVDTSHPDHVIGTGTPASCTSAQVVRAVREGGVITFDCGPAPVTIRMRRTAKVVNESRRVVIDGGGLVTLDGGGQRRILYQNTCDPQLVWTTSHCDDQASPQLVVQRITLAHGSSVGEDEGGGAIFARGGRLRIVDATFVGNRCQRRGPDVGGAAVRVFDQHRDQPVYVVGSTFRGGRCSNGGALSSIGVSWRVLNSTFEDNRAIGRGANPQRPGTAGGGSGGAIYLDGNRFTLDLAGTVVRDNTAREGGGAVFFVSNDRTGTMRIRHSTLERNPSAGFETPGLPGIFFLGARRPTVTQSVLR